MIADNHRAIAEQIEQQNFEPQTLLLEWHIAKDRGILTPILRDLVYHITDRDLLRTSWPLDRSYRDDIAEYTFPTLFWFNPERSSNLYAFCAQIVRSRKARLSSYVRNGKIPPIKDAAILDPDMLNLLKRLNRRDEPESDLRPERRKASHTRR